jgi:glycosyltransferase involved in cell wall biosynthesis
VSPTSPTVTVVVPTHDRRAFLPDVVAALQAQTHGAFRAVLVDDGSTDGTPGAARDAIGDDARFTVLSTPNRGPAAARNAGWARSTTEWVAFTDDDCVPQPGWLAGLLEEAAAEGADVVQGRTVPDPGVDRAELPWWSRSQRIESWSDRYQTCNLLVRAALLRSAGGFDERFPPEGFGEDTDLGLRLRRAGAVTAFAEHAVVHHRVIPMGYREFLRRRYRWAQVVRLVALNPEARCIFPHPYVAHRAHVAFWVGLPAAAWALRTRRTGLLLAGAAAYGAKRGRTSRAKGRSALVRTAYGTTELGGIAAGAVGFLVASVRHRRLLL